MDWLDHHRRTESLMFKAGEARRAGERRQMSELLLSAAESEISALQTLNKEQVRTWADTTVSIASLYFQAGELNVAERHAAEFLVHERTSPSARERLREVLACIWAEHHRRDRGFTTPPDALMVALDDGDLDALGISLSVLAKNTQDMKASLIQTAALRLALPFSSRHASKKGIHGICEIEVDGIDQYAHQYSMTVREPRLYQLALPETEAADTPPISHNFFELINAAVESPDDLLPEIVPSFRYRRTLVRKFYQMAPTGRDIELTHIHSPDDSLGVELDPATRQELSHVLQALERDISPDDNEIITLQGDLIGLDLPAGSIKLRTRNQGTHTIIVGKTIVAQYLEQLADREIELFVRSDQGRLLFEGINVTATERTRSNGA